MSRRYLDHGSERSIGLLLLAEVGAMSLWFVSNAILPELAIEAEISAWTEGLLSTAVQVGFVIGAVMLAYHGTADRYDPRKVFAVGSIVAALSNLLLALTIPGSSVQILLRGITGFCLAGVYPVGMKIAVGWTVKRRGIVVGMLVGALTLGSAAPHGLVLIGGADWRFTVFLASLLAFVAGGLIMFARLGPYHATAARFDPSALWLAWRLPKVRLAYAGYFCHMWELYAFWAWIAAALTASFTLSGVDDPIKVARITTFISISFGGLLCVFAGVLADKIGKAIVAGGAMAISGGLAIATAISFGGPPILTILFVFLWGVFVIPDSAQFSALVADNAPPDRAGSLLTFQTAIGFLLAAIVVQTIPIIAQNVGWPVTLALLGVGPILGTEMMRRLLKYSRS